MITLLSLALIALAVVVAVPPIIFFLEVAAAVFLPQRGVFPSPAKSSRRTVAVLVPAHNESTGLLPTLADIKAQLRPVDQLVVVADNCTDDTATVAAAAGADVVMRNDELRKGKGYALACGLDYLSDKPPDVVVIVDADCRLAEGAIDHFQAACTATHRPVQALDLMLAPENSPINLKVAEFAWRLKNWVRPLGLRALGLPCQLMGTGMAFPWNVIRSVDLASGSIVEDLKLGFDLASVGYHPVFAPFPAVISQFPTSAEAVQTQRLRWEQGHIRSIATAAPRLILASIVRGDVSLLAMAFDVAVPPLSLLTLLVIGMSVISSSAVLFGISSTAAWICFASLTALLSGLLLAWVRWGRGTLPPAAILSVPRYLAGKLGIYRRIFVCGADGYWTRAGRTKR
jgi:cellulose synthase/poly-beta-1,6-N-acetylglucosamine synthase-like glycosyltransferase